MNKLLILSLLFGATLASEFRVTNKCAFPIWIATLGKGNPETNVKVTPGHEHTIKVIKGFSGRLWGKTGCQENGEKCDDTRVNTLAEWTVANKAGDIDFYDVSLVDGYNLPMRLAPVAGTFTKGAGGSKYDCGVAGCNKDMNAICPSELQVKKDNKVISCLSACAKFKTDEYCCGGAHNTPATCKSTDWPKNYPAMFKQACPDAYSYAYDDNKSTFTCRPSNVETGTAYEVIFCP